MYPELELIENLVLKPCEFILTNVEIEIEGQEYFAHNFELAERKVKFRTAKITPTKIGQFVSIWKRNEEGITAPFDILDNFDLFIIATRKETRLGVFIFSKMILFENKILSDKMKGGKRGIRVYPIWDLTTSKQAQKTQNWQLKYFLEISQNKQIDLQKAKKLLNPTD